MFGNIESRRGEFNYVTAILILLLLIGIYAGVFVVPPYYNAYRLGRAFEGQILLASKYSDDQIKRNLAKDIEELGIPVDDPLQAVVIDRRGKELTISIDYTFTLPFFEQYEIPISIEKSDEVNMLHSKY
jgi:hypothetical protein